MTMTTDPIPTEAVEAAARALCVLDGRDADRLTVGYIDGHLSTAVSNPDWTNYVDEAHAALTAAAPHIAAQATTDLRAGIEALHRPVHVVGSWNGGLRLDPICETCHGKAGVHECGCWADDDLVPECAECTGKTGKRQAVAWPCPTIRALDALLRGAK